MPKNTVPKNAVPKNAVPNTGAPLFIKRYVRWLFGKDTQQASQKVVRKRQSHGPVLHKSTYKSPRKAPQKVAIATGSIATLALLAVVPGKVASHSIAENACQEVVQSGAEISRGELTTLSAVEVGAANESVRELIDSPYCLLPVTANTASFNPKQAQAEDAAPIVAREAYPLAFDPQAWVVVNYTESGYAGYDFAFKP